MRSLLATLLAAVLVGCAARYSEPVFPPASTQTPVRDFVFNPEKPPVFYPDLTATQVEIRYWSAVMFGADFRRDRGEPGGVRMKDYEYLRVDVRDVPGGAEAVYDCYLMRQEPVLEVVDCECSVDYQAMMQRQVEKLAEERASEERRWQDAVNQAKPAQ